MTGMLAGADLARPWPHDRAPSFFSRAAWDAELAGIALSHVIARMFLAEGAPLLAAVDDTLFKRAGKKVFGALWQHDGAAKGPRPVGYGTRFAGPAGEPAVLNLPLLARVCCRSWAGCGGPAGSGRRLPRPGPAQPSTCANCRSWADRPSMPVPLIARPMYGLGEHREKTSVPRVTDGCLKHLCPVREQAIRTRRR
ncbi:transposase [Streptomyces sp. NPDC051051]|uniref:transposase n=1 Tax=Streptomyces sp. NPDC051051 TaxID=3155666 RepID=UPI00341575D0